MMGRTAAIAAMIISLAAPVAAADWTYVSAALGVTMYYRPPVLHGSAPNLVRIWVRWEYTAPQGLPNVIPAVTYLSAVELEEIDCTEMRARSLQDTYFSQSSMGGEAPTYAAPTPSWSYEIPGTMGDQIAQLACHSAR
jgi:hypothetical protein